MLLPLTLVVIILFPPSSSAYRFTPHVLISFTYSSFSLYLTYYSTPSSFGNLVMHFYSLCFSHAITFIFPHVHLLPPLFLRPLSFVFIIFHLCNLSKYSPPDNTINVPLPRLTHFHFPHPLFCIFLHLLPVNTSLCPAYARFARRGCSFSLSVFVSLSM